METHCRGNLHNTGSSSTKHKPWPNKRKWKTDHEDSNYLNSVFAVTYNNLDFVQWKIINKV